MIKPLLNILIFLIQTTGIILVGVGLEMIWTPLGWIYAGAAAFAFGHLMYLAMKSEETKK